jgi:bacillithiol system protein YtxJ
MGWFSQKSTFPWKHLSNENVVRDLLVESNEKPVIIFKHSTRCSISSMSLSRFEREWDTSKEVSLYYLDLLNYRDLSNSIAQELHVNHQSPQVIVINRSEVIYQESHNGIDALEISRLI